MADKNNMFGFELLQALYDSQIAKKEDVIILLVHWHLLKFGFRCIGLGNSKTFDGSEKGSELLPEGWNTHPSYTFRYVHDKKLYIFHGIRSDEDLLINLLKIDNQGASSAQFPINQVVNNLHEPLETLIFLYQSITNTIQNDLIDPLLPRNTAGSSTQRSRVEREERRTDADSTPDPLRVDRGRRPLSVPDDLWDPATDLSNVGSADLNPFARGGGGMMFDPFSPLRNPVNPRRPALGVPGRLPPEAVPPYARFDPFGPPDIPRPMPRRNPDDDHLPPPDYNDMFM